MPRIDIIRIHRWLWLAVTVNDFSEYGFPRFGVSCDHARDRCFRAFEGFDE